MLGRVIGALLLAGCGHAAPSPPARAASSVPRSCAADGRSATVAIDGRAGIGTVAGIDVILATRGDTSGLAWLDEDGALSFLPLPLPPELCAPEDDGVRCFVGPRREIDGSITPLRTFRAGFDGAGPVERWEGAPMGTPTMVASSGHRVLVLIRDLEGAHHLVVRGPDDRSRSAAARVVEGPFEPLDAWCDGDRCWLLGVTGQGPARRLVRMQDGGAPVVIADELGVETAIVRAGAQRIVFWTDDLGVHRLVPSDDPCGAHGEAGEPSAVGWRLGSTGRLRALDEGLLGVRDEDGWSLVTVESDGAIGPRRRLGIDAVGLKAARLGDGVVAVGLSGDVEVSSEYGFHAWQFDARWQWRPERGEPRAWRGLLAADQPSAGDGRGGWDVFLLRRPDRAAALVVPRGDTTGARRLVPLRTPCTSANASPSDAPPQAAVARRAPDSATDTTPRPAPDSRAAEPPTDATPPARSTRSGRGSPRSTPSVRLIQPDGGIARCPDDAPEGCVCDIACDLRFERTGLPPEGEVEVRYPFVEVDGLALTIAPDGRVTRCRYSRLGAPEQTVERTCALGP